MLKDKVLFVFAGLVLINLLISSCENTNRSRDKEKIIMGELDSASSRLIKYNNIVFSIPSPYQMALMIKTSGLTYNRDLLNSPQNNSRYNDSYYKSLNIGIYGADLAYCNIYEQLSDAISYFSVVKILAQEMNLDQAFDKQTMQRIENNISNKDSLLFIISNTYRKTDAFLKENQREEVGVLILAGGWIEGLYLLCEVAMESKNKEIINRIGEHKQPLKNLLKMIEPYISESKQFDTLYNDLSSLDELFSEIQFVYIFKEPQTDISSRFTTINSSSDVQISNAQLVGISEKIKNLHKKVTLQ